MAPIEMEKLMEEMIKSVKENGDLSVWRKNRFTSPLLSIISELNRMPKTAVPQAELSRVKNQILDRISVPVASEEGWFAGILPKFLKIGVVSIGSLLIVISLGLGTAVAALESVPGQTIYPLKKAVENVQLKLASEDEKASLQLRFANKRIDELQRIIEQKEQGKISDEEAQKVISETVKDLKVTTDAAASVAATEPKVVDKLADLSNKIKSASIQTDGETKVELEKALAATQVSQGEAIKNIESAGLQVENKPIAITGLVTASGKITEITSTTVSIGTAQFHLTDTTEYVDLTASELETGIIVDIEGEIKDNKTYAVKIILISKTESEPEPEEQTSGAQTTNNNQSEDDEEIQVIPESQ